MSLIVLYFLYSTSVLSFYIDVVLTLSIRFMLNMNFWWLFIISTHSINRNDNNVVEDRAVLTLKGTASFNMSNVNTHSFWPFRTRFLSVAEQGRIPGLYKTTLCCVGKFGRNSAYTSSNIAALIQFTLDYFCEKRKWLALYTWANGAKWANWRINLPGFSNVEIS